MKPLLPKCSDLCEFLTLRASIRNAWDSESQPEFLTATGDDHLAGQPSVHEMPAERNHKEGFLLHYESYCMTS